MLLLMHPIPDVIHCRYNQKNYCVTIFNRINYLGLENIKLANLTNLTSSTLLTKKPYNQSEFIYCWKSYFIGYVQHV